MSQDEKDIELAELKDMLEQLNKTVSSLQDTIASQTELLRQKDATYVKLMEEVTYLRKKLFGTS